MLLYRFAFLVCILWILLTARIVRAQESTPALEQVRIARSELIDLIIAGDRVVAEQKKDALHRQFVSEYLRPLQPAEYILISYWTNAFSDALSEIDFILSEFEALKTPPIYPQDRSVGQAAARRVSGEFRSIRMAIDMADLPEVEKQMLHLFLADIFTEQKDQEKLNLMADAFLAKHPKSKYDQFVRKVIRHRIVEFPWSIGFGFYGGTLVAGGTLNRYAHFRTHVLAQIFARYGNHEFQMFLPTGTFTRKEPRQYPQGEWPTSVRGELLIFGGAYERILNLSRNWQATAGAGVIHTTYKPLIEDGEKEFAYLEKAGDKLGFQPVVQASIGYNFRLGMIDPRVPNQHIHVPVSIRYYGTRLDGGEGIGSGFVHSFTLGVKVRSSFLRRQN